MKINKEQYDVIYTKAQSLKESALILAETKSYNEAISLLILSMEELIKYMVIMLSEKAGFPLDEKIKKQMFREHPPKHNFIKEYFDSFSDECSSDFLFHLYMPGYSFFDAVKNAANPFAVWAIAFCLFEGNWKLTCDQK
ncbi:MAG: AbiV family abortive infection protein [Chitinophagaceae bacterium]|nr:AbiV family abortive infection protein [Chitinophagaceae bacterium]